MMFFLLPKNLARKYGDNLRRYEQNLVAAYDLYNSFSFLAGDSHFNINGVNIFEKNKKARCCEDADLDDFCICKCKNKFRGI